jgi:sodium transport system ATP-binding protein
MIEIEGLKKSFGAVKAVDGIAFTAADGAITTLLGGNGSGKTTTLRAICGLIRPDRGRIAIDRIDVGADRLGALARLGALHDEFGLYPRLTPREHLHYSGALQGMSGKALDLAVARAIELFEIGGLADRRTKGFSHGERMKVALARACVHGPQNLLLDEPTRGLDIFAIRMLRGILKRLRDEGTCILMSSHVMAEVTELSDQVVLISAGRLVAAGSVPDIKTQAGAPDLESSFVTLVAEKTP